MTFRTIARRGYPLYAKSSTEIYIDKLLHSGINVLWDASSDVYEDVNLADLAENNDDVAGWKDQGINQYNATEATNRPVYNTPGLNNRPFIRYTRANSDQLSRAITGGIVSSLNIYNIFCVWRTSSTFLLPSLYGEGGTNATQFVAIRINSGTPGNVIFQHRDNAGTIAQLIGGSSLNNNNLHLLSVRRIATNSWDMRIDGISVATNNANVGVNSGVTTAVVGGRFANSLFTDRFDGDIFMVGISFSDSYSNIEPILATRYGIAI